MTAHGGPGIVDDDVDPVEVIPDGGGQIGRPVGSDRSATQRSEWGDVARQSASTESSRSTRRATRATVSPRAASSRATASPMPDEAPVTKTVRLAPPRPSVVAPIASTWIVAHWTVMAARSADGTFGVSEGSRTPDLQDHNLAL